MDRYLLFTRGVNISKEILPMGGGPGSQVRLMYSDKIPFNESIYNTPFLGDSLNNDIHFQREYVRKRMGSGRVISSHNTYLDHPISLGIVGILIAMFILLV